MCPVLNKWPLTDERINQMNTPIQRLGGTLLFVMTPKDHQELRKNYVTDRNVMHIISAVQSAVDTNFLRSGNRKQECLVRLILVEIC